MADWHNQNNNQIEVIHTYEKAIAVSPSQNTAYYELGKIYADSDEPDKAIETWNKYLEHDSHTLSAAYIRNSIGELWIKQGEHEKAYNVFLESQRSGQAAALVGFANSSELIGKTLQAEEVCRKAAERYPRGICPAKLGVFYLRQGNREAAIQVFREYKRYNHTSYYFNDLIDYYKDLGTPEKAIDFIKTLENPEKRFWPGFASAIAEVYADKKHYLIAADLIRSILGRSGSSRYIQQYWDYSVNCNNRHKEEIIDEIVGNANYRSYLPSLASYITDSGDYLSGKKLYDKMSMKFNLQNKQNGGETGVLNYAIAWRLGGQDPDIKKKLKTEANKFPENNWLRNCLLLVLGETDASSIMTLRGTPGKMGELYHYLAVLEYEKNQPEKVLKCLLMALENMDERGMLYDHAYQLASRLGS
jgi:tetratricopeptide (TPR) repeat protein